MKKLLTFSFLILSIFLTPAIAGTINVPKKDPGATVNVPDSWAPEEMDSGIACESPDTVATVFFEVTEPKKMDVLIDENIDWLVKEHKVEINAKSKKEKDVKIAEREWSRISWDANSKEYGEAIVGFLFTDLGNGQVMTVTYWITKKDAEKHLGTLEKMFASVKAVE